MFPLLRFWDISVSLIWKLHIWRIRVMIYRRMLYIFAIIKRNHFKMYMFGVVGETHVMITYNILRYIIASILRHMCNLHLKETEISRKRSKGIKTWKITYSVLSGVLSNKTNLILGFSSPLKETCFNKLRPKCSLNIY